MQLSFVDLQGPMEAAAMEMVQLSSHSHLPPRSVSRRGSSVPLIESIYHSLIFLLARGRGCGEHFFMECQSGDDHNSCTSLWWKMLYLAFQTSVSHKQLTEASVWASCTWNFHPHPQAL